MWDFFAKKTNSADKKDDSLEPFPFFSDMNHGSPEHVFSQRTVFLSVKKHDSQEIGKSNFSMPFQGPKIRQFCNKNDDSLGNPSSENRLFYS